MNSADHLLLKGQYKALGSVLSVTFLNSLPVFLDVEFNSVFFCFFKYYYRNSIAIIQLCKRFNYCNLQKCSIQFAGICFCICTIVKRSS